MNTLPAPFEERMRKLLGEEAPAFFDALQTEPPVSIRLNPRKFPASLPIFPQAATAGPVSWCPDAFYLNARPLFTLDPYLHGGAYYVQEASSMFIAHILNQILPEKEIRALDLCAAPGGKSTLLSSLLPPDSVLVANEVIRSRATILKENIIKWGSEQVVVTNNDPSDFGALRGAFDLILVDAPCSGEGMFRKDPNAIQEWSEHNLQLCSERQRRILQEIWDCLKPGGFLIYSTCTYHREENEAILEWLLRQYDARSVEIRHSFDSITPGYSEAYCYRFYPHKTRGEGFFTGVIQKTEGPEFHLPANKKNKISPVSLPAETRALLAYPELYTPYANEQIVGILPVRQAAFIRLLDNSLRVLYKGCEVAEIIHKKVRPLPALALWQGLNQDQCPIYQADKTTALTFLKKEDIPPIPLTGDWILITHEGIGLGLCKNLGNRLNNYYHKEWRIRMKLNT